MDYTPPFRMVVGEPPATDGQIQTLLSLYPRVPSEYLEIVRIGTFIELVNAGKQWIRIWGPLQVIESAAATGLSSRIPGGIPVADDEGDMMIFYWQGPDGFGLYETEFGIVLPDHSEWVAPSLRFLVGDLVTQQE